MKKNTILKILFGRVARNVYFWMIYIIFPVININYNEDNKVDILNNIFLNVCTTLIFASVVYVNNLYLLPRIFNRKKKPLYFLVLAIWIIASSFAVEVYYDLIFKTFPEIYSGNDGKIPDFPFFGAMFLVVLHITGFTMAKFANDYFVREKWTKELERKQVESELNFLKSQINPHFLFNTLNSVYSLALKKSDDTADVVLKLSDLLRYMLYECNAEKILLTKEINMLRNYIELEKIRTRRGDRINFELTGNPDNLIVAPLIWIHFVENAFKHGMGSRVNDGFVNIKMNVEGDKLELICANNFKEMEKKQDYEGGIGLDNVKKRLRLLYAEKHNLSIVKKDDIYTVQLTIIAEPLIEKQKSIKYEIV